MGRGAWPRMLSMGGRAKRRLEPAHCRLMTRSGRANARSTLLWTLAGECEGVRARSQAERDQERLAMPSPNSSPKG